MVHAIDVGCVDPAAAKFAEFTFFGTRGDIVVGKDAVFLVATARGRVDYVPPDLEATVGKEFIVVVMPKNPSLDADYTYFQVQSVEPMAPVIPIPTLLLAGSGEPNQLGVSGQRVP